MPYAATGSSSDGIEVSVEIPLWRRSSREGKLFEIISQETCWQPATRKSRRGICASEHSDIRNNIRKEVTDEDKENV